MASNFFMQMFNVCTLCMQSIRWLQQKLWHKLISPSMYYLSTNKTLIKKQCKKWLSSKRCHFVKKYFYGIKLLHANVQCVYIVYTKYQDVSVKVVEQVDINVSTNLMDFHHCLFKLLKKNQNVTNGRTDTRTERRTDGRTT